MINNNVLKHHGVKGMKWGIRNKPDQTASKERRDVLSPTRNMTNQELQAAVTRLNLEKQYKQYMADLNPTKADQAKKATTTVLKTVGTAAATAGSVLTLIKAGQKIYKFVRAG